MWSRLSEYADSLAEIVAPDDENGSVGTLNEQEEQEQLQKLQEDEQEQYIGELERALLQRKKQNDALERQVRALEVKEEEYKTQHAQCEERLEQKEQELSDMRARINVGDAPPSVDWPSESRELANRVSELEKLNADLEWRCHAAESQLEHYQQGSPNELPSERTSSSCFPTLAEALRMLSKSRSSDFAIPDTAQELANQMLEASRQCTLDLQRKQKELHQLQSSVLTFLQEHSDLPFTSPEEVSSDTLDLELAEISSTMSRTKDVSVELSEAQDKIQRLEETEESQLRTILRLQAQAKSSQATHQRTSQSIQQETASKEVEWQQVLQEKADEIQHLQATNAQLQRSVEHLSQELDDCTNQLQTMETENEDFQSKTTQLEEELARVTSQKESLEEEYSNDTEIRTRAGEYEQAYISLLSEMEDLKVRHEGEMAELRSSAEEHAESADRQRIYELESSLSSARADQRVAEEDAGRFRTEVQTLESVLYELRQEQKQQSARVMELEDEVARKEEETKVEDKSDVTNLTRQLTDKVKECDQLRTALEDTVSRYASESDALDKRLAAQLVVSYFESEKKEEILDLIARMMDFSEDQKRRVGMGGYAPPGNGGGGLFSSLLGLSSSEEETKQVSIDGKSFADVWTEFLLDEANK